MERGATWGGPCGRLADVPPAAVGILPTAPVPNSAEFSDSPGGTPAEAARMATLPGGATQPSATRVSPAAVGILPSRPLGPCPLHRGLKSSSQSASSQSGQSGQSGGSGGVPCHESTPSAPTE